MIEVAIDTLLGVAVNLLWISLGFSALVAIAATIKYFGTVPDYRERPEPAEPWDPAKELRVRGPLPPQREWHEWEGIR